MLSFFSRMVSSFKNPADVNRIVMARRWLFASLVGVFYFKKRLCLQSSFYILLPPSPIPDSVSRGFVILEKLWWLVVMAIMQTDLISQASFSVLNPMLREYQNRGECQKLRWQKTSCHLDLLLLMSLMKQSSPSADVSDEQRAGMVCSMYKLSNSLVFLLSILSDDY